jgi:hypothetical protein
MAVPIALETPLTFIGTIYTIHLVSDAATILNVTVPTAAEQVTLASETFLVRGASTTVSGVTISWKPEVGVGPATLVFTGPAATQSTKMSESSVSESSAPVTSTGSPISSATPTHVSNGTTTHTGISDGAIAGATIGCFIAGALLAGLILWFLWRRRRPTQSRDQEASKIALMSHGKGFSDTAAGAGYAKTGGTHAAAGLPLPLEDKAITGEISKISNSIKNHVQSYYHTGRVNPGLIDVDDVQALGSNLPISAGILSTLLSNSATREMALRFCIAWVACSRMLPNAGSSTSFLPAEVAGFSQKTSPTNAASHARWRSSSADLLHSSYVANPYSASDSRNKNIEAAIVALDNVLQPYADSRVSKEERRRNLEEILKRCASFAFTLFSQPSTWDFDWKTEHSGNTGELCIFPALVQLTDEHGANVHPPRPFSEAVVRKLDE